MTFVIEQTIEVTATPAVVWEVIVDLPRHGEWNPFVVECRSTLAVGDPIDMRVHVFAAFAHPRSARRSWRTTLFGEVYVSEDAGESWRKIAREFGEIRTAAWLPA